MSKERNEFWTDERVMEFVHYTLKEAPTLSGRYSDIERFKKSKQPKAEWEIVSYVFESVILPREMVDRFGDGKDYAIHSVRRLSDSVVFSVGDEVGWDLDQIPGRRGEPKFKIESFNINTIIEPHRMFVNNRNICIDYLSHVQKPVKPLFVTEDGVEYREGMMKDYSEKNDWGHLPTVNIKTFEAESCDENSPVAHGEYPDIKIFFSKEKRDEYILLHKPILSIDDFMRYLYNPPIPENSHSMSHLERLKQLAKEKINK